MGRGSRERDAAWDLLHWMGTSQEFLLGTNATTGLPYTESLAKRAPELWPKPLADLGDRHIRTARIGVIRPFGIEGVQARHEILRPLCQKLQLGAVDVRSTWNEASRRIDQILARQAHAPHPMPSSGTPDV